MPNNDHPRLDVAELERRLLAVEPAVVLAPPRVLRRIIKHDCKLPGMGLQVPHRKSYVIGRDKALAVADREELLIPQDRTLPDTLILLARPDDEKLEQRPPDVTLVLNWRLLFHARVHMALPRSLEKPDQLRRIHSIGFTEFDEIRTVLRQERFFLPPGDDRTAYEEFAALYLELRHFAPGLLPRYFPTLQDLGRIDRLLTEEIDGRALFQATRLEGAPDPDAFSIHEAENEASESGKVGDLQGSGAGALPRFPTLARSHSLLRRADQALARGNVVRSAIQRERAAAASPAEQAPGIRADARSDLDRLATRLQAALDLRGHAAEEWRRALPPLLAPAAHGVWTVEARLLYDLQKVCIEHERGIYSVDVVEWIIALGKRPFRRPLPGVREVRTVKYLRKALRRLRVARLADEDRQPLATLLQAAVHSSEENLREHFRPLVHDTLLEVGLEPKNLPERIAFNKLIEELLDRVNDRGLLTIGDFRDALSRNQLKMPDLAGANAFFSGDAIIRGNRKFALSLDGVYRRGEVYLRWLQRLSALGFGTSFGRWLTRFLAIPFGGAFVTLFAIEEILGLLGRLHFASSPATEAPATSVVAIEDSAHSTASPPEASGPELVNLYSVAFLGMFLLLLLHVPAFRCKVVDGLRLVGRIGRAVLVDLPAGIVRLAWLQRILQSWPVVLAHHYVIKPLTFTALIAGICFLTRAGPLAMATCSGGAFLLATLWLNTRVGRQYEEAITEWYLRGWRYLWVELVPGVIRLSLDVFKSGMEAIERMLYTVDEWLRFRQGDSRLSLVVKPTLGLIWFAVTYLIRVVLNLFVEPTFNPIKHFPTVTVAAKLITPMMVVMRPQMLEVFEPMLGTWLANGLVVLIIGLVPGLAGFLVWEFKENWKLYASNRAPNLRAVVIGHHGETMLRFLKPGFHSGTIPRLYAKMRRASRSAQKTGDWRAFRKFRAALHHVTEAMHRFLEREFLALLEESQCWKGPSVTIDLIRLGSNNVRVAFGAEDISRDDLVVLFEERAGWLVVQIAEPGWLGRLQNEQRRVFVNTLIGLYKLAGVHLVREQIISVLPAGAAYDVTDRGLIVWPSDTFAAEATYDLCAGPILAARLRWGTFPLPLPSLPEVPLVFGRTPVTWSQWVEAWEKDQCGKGHPKPVIHGVCLLPRV